MNPALIEQAESVRTQSTSGFKESPSSGARGTRLSRVQFATVLLLAAGLRIALIWHILAHQAPAWYFARGQEMGLLANSLLQGHGLSSPFGAATGPTAIIAPGYPLLVAAVFRIFGSYSLDSAAVLMGISAVFNVLTVWLIMRLAQRIAGSRAALFAGCLWAVSPPLLWMPTIFWETSLSSFLLLAAIAVAIQLTSAPRTWPWPLLGAGVGVAGLLNPALLPSLTLIILWSAWNASPRVTKRPLLLALVFLAVYLPWPLRNARVFHAWVPTRTTVGIELWMGNHPGSDGYLQESLFPTFHPAELHAYEAEGEIAYSNGKAQIATAYIWSHRARFLQLSLLRFLRFWSGAGSRNGSGLFVLYAALTTLLGILGVLKLFRSKQTRTAILFLLPMLVFPLPYYITHAEFRYRLVLDPLMTLLAGVALAYRSPHTHAATVRKRHHQNPVTA